MYCVRCGVKLQDGVDRCPLCDTPVILPTPESRNEGSASPYSDQLPPVGNPINWIGLVVTTVMLGLAAIVCMVVNLRYPGSTPGSRMWAGIAMLAIALLWVLAVLPKMFRKPNPILLVPVDSAAIGGFLLYVCLHTGGHWFLSFAFPLTGIVCILAEALLLLLKYTKGGRLFIAGGTLIAFGSSLMLVEFFEHITFGHRMFTWSLFGVSVFGFAGLFIIAVALIPTLKAYMERRTFI